MPARYWVGGAGVWNATDATHWSAASGGVSGSSPPTVLDDAFFDANSGTGTVTTDTTAVCRSLTTANYGGTLALVDNPTALTVAGDLILSNLMTLTWGATSRIVMNSASTGNRVRTMNKTMNSIYFTGGGSWETAAPLVAGTLELNSGTFTAPFDVFVDNLLAVGALAATFNFSRCNVYVKNLDISGALITLNTFLAPFIVYGPSTATRVWVTRPGQTLYEVQYNTPNSPGPLHLRGGATITTVTIGAGHQITYEGQYVIGTQAYASTDWGYFDFPFLSGQYISTTDKNTLDLTDDVDIRAKIGPNLWNSTQQTIIGKWATSQMSYRLALTSDGRIRFGYSIDGTNTVATDSDVLPYAATNADDFGDGKYGSGKFNGEPVGWVRATRVRSTGNINFFTSTEGTTWTPLGSTQTQGTQAIFVGTSPLEVGSSTNGTIDQFAGNIYFVEVRSGVGGTVVATFDADARPLGSITHTDPQGNVWSLNGGLVPVGGGVVLVNLQINDNLGILDTHFKTVNLIINDALGMTDPMNQAGVFTRTINDSIGMTDSVNTLLARIITDLMGITDNWSTLLDRTVSDVLGMTDTTSQVGLIFRTVVDTLGLSDQVVDSLTLGDLIGILIQAGTNENIIEAGVDDSFIAKEIP